MITVDDQLLNNHELIQELLYYAESRFMKILMALDNLPENRHEWLKTGLHKEIVSFWCIQITFKTFLFNNT